MEDEGYISPELAELIEEFGKIRDSYVAMSAYVRTQEAELALEKERSDRMREDFEKLSRVHSSLESRHKSAVEQLENEKMDLRRTIEELTERCDRLLSINIDRNQDDGQIYQLQDELEVLKAQLSMQEVKHNEDVARAKREHSDEIQRYKMLLQNATQNANISKSIEKGNPKGANNKRKASCFRWPELTVGKVNDSSTDSVGAVASTSRVTKKRKLYHEDDEAAIDIV